MNHIRKPLGQELEFNDTGTQLGLLDCGKDRSIRHGIVPKYESLDVVSIINILIMV